MFSRISFKMDGSSGCVCFKVYYGGDIFIISVDVVIMFEEFCEEVRDMCCLY